MVKKHCSEPEKTIEKQGLNFSFQKIVLNCGHH